MFHFFSLSLARKKKCAGKQHNNTHKLTQQTQHNNKHNKHNQISFKMSLNNNPSSSSILSSNKQCEDFLSSILLSSKYLKLKSTLNLTSFQLECHNCSSIGIEGKSKAFIEINPLKIIFCSNRIKNTKESYEMILNHELIHIYDYSTKNSNLLMCNGLAYSEVRAAREGECSYSFFIHSYFKNKCIKDHAIRSTAVSYFFIFLTLSSSSFFTFNSS